MTKRPTTHHSNFMRIAISLLLALALTGCASYRPPTAGTPAIIISKVEERSSRFGAKIALPAGEYVADLVSDDGTYYLAPTSVTISGVLGGQTPTRGGLFVPASSAKDQRQRGWIQYVMPNGLIGALTSSGSSSIQTYPFEEPIQFTLKK